MREFSMIRNNLKKCSIAWNELSGESILTIKLFSSDLKRLMLLKIHASISPPISQSVTLIFYFRLTIPNSFLTRLFNSLNLLFKNKNNIFFVRNWFFKAFKFKFKINTWNRRIWFIVAAAAVGRTRGFGVNDRPPDSLVPPIIELPRRDAMLKDW